MCSFFLDFYFLRSQTVLPVPPHVLIVAGLCCFSCRLAATTLMKMMIDARRRKILPADSKVDS